MVRNPPQASLTRDILLRDVKLFGFMKNIFNFAMSKPTVFVHILHINLNEDVFFPLPHFSYCVDCKRLNKCSILTSPIKITNMLFLRFWTNWPILLKKSSLSATLIIMLTTKCKTNFILDKTNKINSLK